MGCIKNMFKKLFAIIFTLLFLTSCGQSISQEYTCTLIVKDDGKYEVSELFTEPPVLTLFDDNNARLEINGEICDCKWATTGREFTLTSVDRTSCGTLENGMCTIDLFNQGITYVFCADNAPLTDTEEAEKKNNRWSGAWYGYWGIKNASGKWESLDGQYFDCFAVVDMSVDNSGEITLWDENSSMSSPLSVVKLQLAPSSTGYGTAKSESGYFISSDIGKGDWKISPDEEELENVFSFSSHYSSAEGEFDYEIFLRPWGYIWDDAIENEYFRLPYYYYRWYIPMLSSNSTMPDRFEP